MQTDLRTAHLPARSDLHTERLLIEGACCIKIVAGNSNGYQV